MPEREWYSSVEHGGALTQACRLYGGTLDSWLDLSTGINPNPVVLPDIEQSIWNRLPDEDLERRACEAAAGYFDLPDGILPLCVPGTQAAIQRLPAVMPGHVTILGPTYGEYHRCFSRAGCIIETVAEYRRLEARGGNAIIVNPNNPDGRVLSSEAVLELEQRISAGGGYLIVDEAFADVAPEVSVAAHAGNSRRLVVLRSFGKFFGLAGLRIGYVIAPDRILALLRSELGPWAVSGPALALSVAMMSDDACVEEIRLSLAERHSALDGVLTAAGLDIIGGTDLFTLVHAPEAGRLHHNLCRQHILVRKFSDHPGWLRFGLTPDPAADARLLDGLVQSIAAL